jgi:RNA polymerase sigma-70 factor (ECF subfamily)
VTDDASATPAAITELLQAWQHGDAQALDRLVPLVYGELRVIASRHLAGERRATLHTTALVNEAYLKLCDQRRVSWQNRAQFFAIAARLMRRILIDAARRRRSEKRGGDAAPLMVSEEEPVAAPASPVDVVDLLELDRALRQLDALDPDQGRIVELRFFGGLTVEETAEVVGASATTVKREWAIAKGWLHREMTGDRRHDPM